MDTYTVYTLTDGIVEDVIDTDDIAVAWKAFDDAVAGERIVRARAREANDYADTTVHLYEPNAGVLHAEVLVSLYA